MTVLTTAGQFLDCVRKSRLVEEARLVEFLQKIGDAEKQAPEQLADQLIAAGLLTQFQARQLLRSRWQGFLLGGKYRILELLGSGGMGRVFLCEHIRLGIPIAVKVLPPEKMEDEAVLARFQREARAAATLSHPNLVRAFDIDDDGNFAFIVMEYVHGHSLQQLVEERGPFAVSCAVSCIRQAARGLQHFYERGLVHRDIKPGNILLDRYGTVKVLDMGLARFFQDTGDKLTQENMGGSILGTADYVAPEQALDSHQATIQADIYSLGATFYYLLAGHAPFEEGTIAQKMLWHQVRQPPSLQKCRKDVPAEVESVLLRMMAKDPDERFATPAEVAEALAPWDKPCPPLAEEELPTLCPAVQRLLQRASTPVNSQPCLPASPFPGSSPKEAIAAELPDNNVNAILEFLTISPPTPPPRAIRLTKAGQGLRRRHWVWVAGALPFVVLLAWGCYAGYVRYFPPAPRPARPPQLNGFDPLAGIHPGTVIPDYLAVGQIGQTRTVRLTVRDRQREKNGAIYLYSALVVHGDTQAKVFTVAIPSAARAAFQQANIADPYAFYMGQTIDVKGPVKYLTESFNRPGIEAAEPSQIKLVNPQ